jgi:hypothetical protein
MKLLPLLLIIIACHKTNQCKPIPEGHGRIYLTAKLDSCFIARADDYPPYLWQWFNGNKFSYDRNELLVVKVSDSCKLKSKL